MPDQDGSTPQPRDVVSSSKNKKYIYMLFVLFIAVAVTVYFTLRPSSAKSLGTWINQENRAELLPSLLQKSDYKRTVHSKVLPSASPIYGYSQSQVLSLLGPANTSGADELIYDIGNLSSPAIFDVVVPQQVRLHLIFKGNKCVEYRFSS